MQGIGLCDFRYWLGKSEIHKGGSWEMQAGTLWHKLKLVLIDENFFIKKVSALLFKAYHLTESGPLRLFRVISSRH